MKTKRTKPKLQTSRYLPSLYGRLCDPHYATEYIVGLAKLGDEAALRLGVSDLIKALAIHFERLKPARAPHLPEWDDRAKLFNWAAFPAVERSKPKSKHDGRSRIFAGTQVPVHVLFESLADGRTVNEFSAAHSVPTALIDAVIWYARKSDKLLTAPDTDQRPVKITAGVTAKRSRRRAG